MGNQQILEEQFLSIFTTICDYYNRDVRACGYDLYWHELKNFSVEQIQEMFHRHIRNPDTGQFMPKIGDLVKYDQGTTKGNAIEAWHKIYKSISTIGPYQTFTIDDPWAMQSVEEIGGFQHLCELTEKELEFKRNEFEKLYESHKAKGQPKQFPKMFKGIIDKENGTESKPVLIGDAEVAKRVYNRGSNQSGFKLTKFEDVKSLPTFGEH